MRYLKILFLGMVVIGLMASGAWAGTIVANNATPATVALEAMGAARNVTLSGIAGNNAISFTSSRSLISGDLINFTFTNVGTTSDTIYLCETGNNTVMDSINQAANSTTLSLRANRSVTGGTKMFLSTNSAEMATSANCNLADIGQVIVRFPAISSATMATVAFNVTSFGTLIDSASAKNIGNISKQYVTNYVANNSTIDFAANATSNGVRFTGGSNNAVPGVASINYTPMDIQTFAGGATNAGLTVSALLSLQDSASWQGVQRVYVNKGACLATNNAVNNSPSGTVNLSISTAAFNGAAEYLANVCADVKGNQALQTRTIKGAYDISVGTGGNDPAIDTYTTIMQWLPNGYQGIVPYISASSTYGTICFINNKSTSSGSVTADILTSQSGATLTSLSGLSLGTLAALGTMRVDFASSITPYTYSGGIESAGTAVPLTGLQSNDRYSAMINVGTAPTQITVNCIQMDPLGSKRAVPVLTQKDATYTWQQ